MSLKTSLSEICEHYETVISCADLFHKKAQDNFANKDVCDCISVWKNELADSLFSRSMSRVIGLMYLVTEVLERPGTDQLRPKFAQVLAESLPSTIDWCRSSQNTESLQKIEKLLNAWNERNIIPTDLCIHLLNLATRSSTGESLFACCCKFPRSPQHSNHLPASTSF